jgi:subtilisin family serine protease
VAVNAPLLWTLGITGTGVVVGSLDTGVDGTHPELAATWRGDAHAWFDPYHQCATPCDLNGHGTQVMGVMVGGAASGTAIGMAPGATWIAARIFNTTGQAQASTIHLAFQWALDPDGNPATDDAPDVVNASWDVINPGGCDLTFAPDLQALVAAGIVPVFAAGNSGPNPASAVSPANNPDALAVGAVDNAGVVASFSSRGPTSCGTGAARTFPELAAPGVAVSTTDRMVVGDPAPRYVPASGTSLAAPHVAGGLALLISAFPGRRFSAAELRVALSFTARPLPDQASTPNNDTGAGLLDLWAAYEALRQDSLPTATPTTAPSPSPTPTAIWSFASRTMYLPFVRRELP